MKRTFLVRAVGAFAAVVVATATFTLYPAAAQEDDSDQPADPYFLATYEDGSIDSGYSDLNENRCCDHSVWATGNSRYGEWSVRHQIRDTDSGENTHGMRAESHSIEMADSYFGHGMTRYYSFSVYIPTTWEDDSEEDVVFQWHNWPDRCEDQKWPSAFLAIQPGPRWELRVNSDAEACTTRETFTLDNYRMGRVETGQWTDFVFRYDWAYDDSGLVQAWMRGGAESGWTRVLEESGPNTWNDTNAQGYLKWGIYKPAWNHGPTDVSTRTVWHDNVAAGPTWDSVEPEPDPPVEPTPSCTGRQG